MADHPTDAGQADSEDPLSELRQLLFSPEQEKLESIQERLDDPDLHAVDISRVLPEAVIHRNAQDDKLAKALAPTIESSFQVSVKRNPQVLVDVISPIMGPAIRASISHAISSMVASLNQTMEHSLSVQGLKWRIEAARTGRSFGEVVMLHTLVYRVEQVLLIHKETGLLLQHVVAGAEDAVDPDMVSGMLTAIQDFVKDSFSGGEQEALHTLRVGDLDVWIEQGPQAVVAAVIRGQAPGELRVRFLEAIEEIHQQMGQDLDDFAGDAAPFEAIRPILQETLQSRFQEPAKKEKQGKNPLVYLVPAAICVLIGYYAYHAIEAAARFDDFVARLRDTPGIHVTDVGTRGEAYLVRGLRDPLAEQPSEWSEAQVLSAPLVLEMEPYYSFASSLQLARARSALRPPAKVRLEVDDTVLRVSGIAPHAWVEAARASAQSLPGFTAYDDKNLVDADEQRFDVLRNWIEAQEIGFEPGRIRPGAVDDARLAAVADSALSLLRVSRTVGRRTSLHILGETDASGDPRTNQRLSEGRGAQVADRLAAAGIPDAALVVSTLQASSETGRRVTFRVISARQ